MNVHDFMRDAFDMLFPPGEDALLVRALTPNILRSLLCPRSVDGCVCLSDFCDARIRALIHEAKFHANRHAQELLGELLAAYVAEHPELRDAVFIPIPLSAARRRERGYNQVFEVLDAAQRKFAQLRVNTTLLVRSKNTRPQTEMGKDDRERNVAGAFMVKKPGAITGAHIVLVDDVLTTGATMRAAKLALSPHAPEKISLLAFAH